jgi:predicted oxidoreductase
MSLGKLDWVNSGVLVNHNDYKSVDFSVGTIEYCIRNDIELQAWGAMSSGLFSGKPLVDDVKENIINTVKLVEKLAFEKDVSKESIVLAWLMRHPAGIRPIIGTTNPDRIKAVADISKVTISRREWYDLFIASRGKDLT